MAHQDDDGRTETPLGSGREFDLIRRFAAQWGERATGLGDDAAVLDVPAGSRLVASVDSAAEGVHFRREWLSAREIGYRAAAAALSDLAAMGAAPLGLLVALVLPSDYMLQGEDLMAGVGEAAAGAGCPIVGGDTSHGERVGITVTVLGHAARPVRRSGVQPGDAVYVTGHLGGPGAALVSLLANEIPKPSHRIRFAHPVPRVAEARWLADHNARAMIDISDGLVSDAEHIAAASGVSIEIDIDRLPLVEGVPAVDAARSGEEYELLVAGAPTIDVARFQAAVGTSLTRIGTARAGANPVVTFLLRGERVDLGRGYDHFSA